MRLQHARRWVLGTALIAVVAFIPQTSSADDWYPGLPDQTTLGTWSNAAQGGMSYAKRAKQWFRTPQTMTTAAFEILVDGASPDGHSTGGGVHAEGYFVSPKGAPANYGYLEPMTVRSVGFGLMPVEATVQVSQRRKNGYPIPVHVLLKYKDVLVPKTGINCPCIDNMTASPVTISDAFNVRILDVKVDGVDMGLSGNCRTSTPAPVTVSSPAYEIDDITRYPGYEAEWYATHDPSTYFHPLHGGELNGSMTIPPFTGCTTKTGDDLSRLMTLSVSGAGNPVSARAAWPCDIAVNGAPAPAPPGAATPKLATTMAGGKSTGFSDYCFGAKPFDYPARSSH